MSHTGSRNTAAPTSKRFSAIGCWQFKVLPVLSSELVQVSSFSFYLVALTCCLPQVQPDDAGPCDAAEQLEQQSGTKTTQQTTELVLTVIVTQLLSHHY